MIPENIHKNLTANELEFMEVAIERSKQTPDGSVSSSDVLAGLEWPTDHNKLEKVVSSLMTKGLVKDVVRTDSDIAFIVASELRPE